MFKPPVATGRSRISKRVLASLVVLGVAAPAALASSTSARQGIVHAYVDRSGTVVVTGYDGGVGLTAGHPAATTRP